MCLLPVLIEIDGDNLARVMLMKHQGMLAYIMKHADICDECRKELERLFPNGPPDIDSNVNPPELEEILEKLRNDPDIPPIGRMYLDVDT
jgi:hypothetical protein